MFDFTPVGACLAIGGVVFLGLRLALAAGRPQGRGVDGRGLQPRRLLDRSRIPESSPLAGKTVGEIEKLSEGDVEVLTLLRSRDRSHQPPAKTKLRAGDMLILIGQPDALKRLTSTRPSSSSCATKTPARSTQPRRRHRRHGGDRHRAESPLVDRSPAQYRLYEHHQVNLLAVSRSGRRIAHRIGSTASSPATSSCCRAT